MAKKNIFILMFAILSGLLFSQEALKSIEEEYYDYLSLEGITERPALGYRTLSDSVWNLADKYNSDTTSAGKTPVWNNLNLGSTFTLFEPGNINKNWYLNGINQNIKLKIYGPEWYNSYNTAVPYGYNDGALWQGKGYNTSFSAGVRLEGYGFELTLKPDINFAQNLSFEYKAGSKNPYNYFVGGIDLVQRYGDSSFWDFDWGDSEVRYTLYNFTIGFGTQNPWLGPAWLNPMLGSNNAASYPKIDMGLRRTELYIPFTDIYLGDIEGRAFIGRLEESEYFDKNIDNNYRMLNGLSASYSPSFIPGLTVGANRIFITKWGMDKLKYFARLFTLSTDNDVTGDGEDQKASVFFSWHFPEVGFEAYGEYGFDDFTSDKKANPFHTGIYTVGFKQIIPLPWDSVKSQLFIELNNFEMSQDFQLQWQYIGYYGHGKVPQGYTNNGQILGAGTGFFGNSQFIGYKVYYPKGDSMLYFHRYCPNNNYVYNQAVIGGTNGQGSNSELCQKYYASNETYFVFGLSSDFFPVKSLSVSCNLSFIRVHNYLYKKWTDDFMNVHFELGAKYRF